MEKKKILVAVDDSVHSQNALRYVARTAETVPDLNYVLLNVLPAMSQFMLAEAQRNQTTRTKLNQMAARDQEHGQQMLQTHQQQLVKAGIAAERITLKTCVRSQGLAKDILAFGENGHYDAIVLGRRGASWLRETIMGSVTADVLEHSKVLPVWLVDGDIKASKIMIAVDGSENALKAVDHLGFMVGANPDVRLLFFHVRPKLGNYCAVDFDATDADGDLETTLNRENQNCIDRFFQQALDNLAQHGIDAGRIETEVVDGVRQPGKTILDKIEQDNIGTLVMGRRGLAKSFFTGSVSRYVINKFSNGALWLVN